MPKILILENEELFKAISQFKDLPPEWQISQVAENNDTFGEDLSVVIGNLQSLPKTNNSKSYFIGLSEQNENANIYDSQNQINIIKKPYRLSEITDIIQDLALDAASDKEVVKVGDFEFDNSARVLVKNEIKITLTEKESELVALLNLANGEVVSRDDILKKVWGYEDGIETHTVETHIYRIRQKLGKDNDFIGNLGIGYFIK